MSHGKDAARDLRYGRRGGRWAPADLDDRSLAEIREQHLADRPKGCRCRWCAEAAVPAPDTLFGDGAA